MTDIPQDERSPYPSRRSLRAKATADATTSPRLESAPPTTDPVAPVDATAEYLRIPVREDLPNSAPSTPAVPPAPAAPQRWSIRRRLIGVAAAASVGGLVLSAAVPLVQDTDEALAAASQQRLFSEVSADDVPASISEISAVDVAEATPGTYSFQPRSLVNYPFTETVLLTDPFGYRTAPVAQFHDAQDFGAAAGTPIQAIADGVVLEAGFAPDGCGFGLKLEHEIDGNTVTSRYCHMQDASHSYQVGDILEMGDPAGRVGSTGMSFGAHLHLALRVNDEPVDPMPFLAKYSRMDRTEEPEKQSGGNGATDAAGVTAADAGTLTG